MALISGVPAADIGRVWPHVEALVTEGCSYSGGRWLAEHIRAFLQAEKMGLWVAHDGQKAQAVAVTEIITYPTGLRACGCVLMAGENAKDWLPAMKTELEAYAAALSCDLTEMGGRKGWQRLLPDYQWTGILLEKRLCSQNPPAS